MGKQVSNKVEWRINLGHGESETLATESGSVIKRIWSEFKVFVRELILKIWNFLKKAWNIGVTDPKKVIHGIKVGVALSVVSLLYYMRPLYDGFGGNAMWAIMTVVVVFEYTVGATLSKCINRTAATFLAGALGLGVHWIAIHSGGKLEPIIIGISVFLLGSSATFSRFIPSVKARFDYGALIFILTFSLVSVSGYRVDELFSLAVQRLSTILIGTSFCIMISMLFYPIWAGTELHSLIHRNLHKLADSIDGSLVCYFTRNSEEEPRKKMIGYKCVLNSKAMEDSMANFARWEPGHGSFNFRHPWKEYLKVGASLRSCAYCIETLNGCINSETQAPDYLRKQLSDRCRTLSFHVSKVLKELANTMKTMTKSTKIGLFVREMQTAAQQLQNDLKAFPSNLTASKLEGEPKQDPNTKTRPPPMMELLQLVTLVSLLIEISTRVEDIIDAVNELARLAHFSNP